jgi:hypothetical protein
MMASNENRPAAIDGTPNSALVLPNITSRRLHIIIAGLWLCLFLSAFDTTIVTTALIKISSDFNALEQSAWVITAYLLTYNCKTPSTSISVTAY